MTHAESPSWVESREVAAAAARLGLLAGETPEYASFMLSPAGQIVTWNIGGTRLHGYLAEEVVGQHLSRLYPRADTKPAKPDEDLGPAAAEGRLASAAWRPRFASPP